MSIEHKYIHNGSLCTLDELHAAGVLLGATQPTEATVYDVEDGTVGTRYTSAADGIIVKSEGDIHYYATQAACDADWTTTEPATYVVAYFGGGDTTLSTRYVNNIYRTSGTSSSLSWTSGATNYDNGVINNKATITVTRMYLKDGTDISSQISTANLRTADIGYRSGYVGLYSNAAIDAWRVTLKIT